MKRVALCRDPADNMLFECCIEAKAAILISGDHDLLQLRNVPFNLRVLTPRKFIEEE
jgi:predicted nucleic acid-binding protein